MIAKKSERMRSLFFGDVLMDVAFVGSKGPYQASGTAESGELGRVGGGEGAFTMFQFLKWTLLSSKKQSEYLVNLFDF